MSRCPEARFDQSRKKINKRAGVAGRINSSAAKAAWRWAVYVGAKAPTPTRPLVIFSSAPQSADDVEKATASEGGRYKGEERASVLRRRPAALPNRTQVERLYCSEVFWEGVPKIISSAAKAAWEWAQKRKSRRLKPLGGGRVHVGAKAPTPKETNGNLQLRPPVRPRSTKGDRLGRRPLQRRRAGLSAKASTSSPGERDTDGAAVR